MAAEDIRVHMLEEIRAELDNSIALGILSKYRYLSAMRTTSKAAATPE